MSISDQLRMKNGLYQWIQYRTEMWLNIIGSCHWLLLDFCINNIPWHFTNFMAVALCTCWCRRLNYQDHNLGNPNTGEEKIHKLTQMLYPLWGLRLAVSLPSTRPFTFSLFSMLVSTLSSVFLTSILDNFLMELHVELLPRTDTYCFPCWVILSSYGLRSGNVPHGATCWVTGQANKTLRTGNLLQPCAPHYGRCIHQD